MTQGQYDVRSKRAAEELFVISTTDDGWRVRSAHNPSQHYLVSGDGEGLRCGCPDFETHSEDPSWTCKHILAVQDHQRNTGADRSSADTYSSEERAAIQTEASAQVEPRNSKSENGKSHPAQMLIKRSISPDGRIDSISIEFSSIVDDATVGEIKSRAFKTLKLQTEIVRDFLGSTKSNDHGNGSAPPNGKAPETNGTVAARMLDMGIAQTAYGERVFLNFDVNGRRARLFGSEQAVLNAIAAAGKRLGGDDIQQGLMLNLPCRVVTEQNGKYLNVTKVFAAARGNRR